MARKEREKRQRPSKESVQKAKRIFRYMKPYRAIFVVGWIFLILSTSTGLVFPYLMGQLLGNSGESPTSMADSVQLINMSNIGTVVLLLFGLFAAQSVFSFFRVLIFTSVTQNTLRDIRSDSFQKLIHMPMDFFNQNRVGELTSRISSDISQIQETLRTTIAEFFRQIVMIFGSMVIIFIISWKLSLIMLSTVPVVILVAVFFGRFVKKLGKQAQDEAAKSNVIIEEGLMGISNVKSFTRERFMINKYRETINNIKAINMKSGLWGGLFVSFIIFCVFGAIVFIVWQGLIMTQGTDPELGRQGFFTIVMFTVMMGISVGSVPDMYAKLQSAIGATENLMNIISQDSETELHKGELKPTLEGNIQFENVSFHYPQRPDIQVLNDVSLSIEKNQTIALVGASGAGKSTIASLLLNYYPVTGGKVAFDGTGVEDIEIGHLRSHIAIVPQEVILFAGSIRENIAFGDTDASEEEIIEAAKQANAWEFIQSFPEKLETEVGDRGIQLSGGQKQRVAIARAILKNPTLLILDEATSALDSESEKLVQEALTRLMKNRTSVVIAHRLSTIRSADKIYVLEKGGVVESGQHDDLISKSGIYAHLVELQAVESNA